MAPVKRKGNVAEDAAVRQPQKRARVGADEQKDQKENVKPSELTVLRDDEPAFPRGGGSVLTPLEKKQIHIQAKRDVLFEQKGSGKPAGGFDSEDEEDAMEDVDESAPAPKKARKAKTKGKKKNAEQDASEKQGVRIEGLNFKVRCISCRCDICRLMCIAHCPWVHDLGPSLQHQRSRYRSRLT